MQRIILTVFGVFACVATMHGQTSQELIERTVAAAPPAGRESAGVIRWLADGSYETVKERANQLVCWDASGEANREPFEVRCTNVRNLEHLAQTRRFDADGSLVLRPESGMIYILSGSDRESARHGGSSWMSSLSATGAGDARERIEADLQPRR